MQFYAGSERVGDETRLDSATVWNLDATPVEIPIPVGADRVAVRLHSTSYGGETQSSADGAIPPTGEGTRLSGDYTMFVRFQEDTALQTVVEWESAGAAAAHDDAATGADKGAGDGGRSGEEAKDGKAAVAGAGAGAAAGAARAGFSAYSTRSATAARKLKDPYDAIADPVDKLRADLIADLSRPVAAPLPYVERQFDGYTPDQVVGSESDIARRKVQESQRATNTSGWAVFTVLHETVAGAGLLADTLERVTRLHGGVTAAIAAGKRVAAALTVAALSSACLLYTSPSPRD